MSIIPGVRSSRPVILTGIAGAGKSTVGEALARRMGWEFVDLDGFIERKLRRSIEEIFATDGESHFRVIENFAVREVLKRRRVVIASGGGTFVQPKNAAWMLAGATMVWLDVPFELAVDHIRNDTKRTRPLAKNLDNPDKLREFRELDQKRRPFYQKAHVHIDASHSLDEIVEDILQRV